MYRSIKNNRILRGIYFLYKDYFRPKNRKFKHIGSNVILTPPYTFGNPSNISIGNNVYIGGNCHISGVNAECIIEGDSEIAEGFTVHTGNHAQVVGKLVSDIQNSNKPAGWDNPVRIERDVWIGCNVTILSGVTIPRGCVVSAGAVVTNSPPSLFYNRRSTSEIYQAKI